MYLTKEQYDFWRKCRSGIHPQLFLQGFGGIAHLTCDKRPRTQILEVRPAGCLDHKHSQYFEIVA